MSQLWNGSPQLGQQSAAWVDPMQMAQMQQAAILNQAIYGGRALQQCDMNNTRYAADRATALISGNPVLLLLKGSHA